MAQQTYIETFDDGPGGWLGWMAGGGGPRALEIIDGAARQTPPWGIDINHAPPGAGYLHLPYVLLLDKYQHEALSGPNRFVNGGYSRNFTNTRFTVRLKGDIELRGADFLLLVQSNVGDICTNWVLSAQPIPITPTWEEVSLRLEPDPDQWLCLGTRGEGADNPHYGEAPIADALLDVDVDIILVLFPLNIQPLEPINGDPHQLRAGIDYAVDERLLPDGEILIDEIRIEYPQ